MRFHRDSGICVWTMPIRGAHRTPSGHERGGILPSVRIAGADRAV